MTKTPSEQCDVVIVGARVAGTATAIELAKQGVHVIVIDAATFPSDTLSTHLIFPSCVAELSALGALDRILASGTPTMPSVQFTHGGMKANGSFSPVDGFDYAMCPGRKNLDHSLIQTAQASGAEIREATKLTGLIRHNGRVTGVTWNRRDGSHGQISCKLVIGADGRRSSVAKHAGVIQPYRWAENGRGLVYTYVDDPLDTQARSAVHQWRIDDTLGMYFPTDDNGGLVLFMGPKSEVSQYGQDLQKWKETLALFPGLEERIAGGQPRHRLRKAADTYSYFRRATGPGWALVGDSAQFKDPAIAQGIRDAIVYGRKLAQTVARNIQTTESLDQHLYVWELQRDRDCLPSYHWGLQQTNTDPISPLELEAYKDIAADTEIARLWMDLFSRNREISDFMTPRNQLTWMIRALRQPGVDRSKVFTQGRQLIAAQLGLVRDLARLKRGKRIRSTGSQMWTSNWWAAGPWEGGADRNLTTRRTSTPTSSTQPEQAQTSEPTNSILAR